MLIFFIPGYAFTWVLYIKKEDISLIVRIALSCVLSIAIVMLSSLFLDFVMGVETTGLNVAIALLIITVYLIILYTVRITLDYYGLPLPPVFSLGYHAIQKYFSRKINSRRDRFTKTETTVVLSHEDVVSGRNHVDHSFLIDVGEEIDIHQVNESKWKISERSLLPPPYPKTRYFELVIRVYKEDGVLLIDDLQIYPVHVSRKNDVVIMGHIIKRGALKIIGRLYEKTDSGEIQWIYSHDFHFFAILYTQDTLGEMVDRVLLKLDEIATSIKSDSRIPSHLEETEKLKDEFDVVLEKPRKIPTATVPTAPHPETSVFTQPIESDRRKLQADIVRDLNVHALTPEKFRKPDKMLKKIEIPEKIDKEKLKASLEDLKDDDWLYE
jgi:hypothetical protein